MPPLVWVSSIIVYAFIVLTGLSRLGKAKILALVGLGAALVVLPMALFVSSNAIVDELIQPR